MRTIETKIYKIDEHPEPELCFDWIKNNWNDLNEHSVHEIVDSIKALRDKIGGTIDWSISQVPDCGEYIAFANFDENALSELNTDDCPLTGAFWDIELIEGLKEGNPSKVLDALHSHTDHVYSDEGLFELCESNEYEFDEYGKCV